jgi:PAS domain S-box-containing protein
MELCAACDLLFVSAAERGESSMHGSHMTDAGKAKPVRIFLIVTSSILISETIAVILISGIRNPLEEIFEVLVLTTLISTMVYFLLIRPMTVEITLRLSAEEGMRVERDRLEKVTTVIGAGLAVIDRNFKVLWSNQLLVQNFESIPGENCYISFKHCYDGPCTVCGVREVIEKGLSQFVSEHRFTDKMGNEGWFQIIVTPLRERDGSINSALELIVPISDRKAIEQALVYSQKQFKNLVESSVDWVWEVDTNSRYTYVGPQCRELIGYEPDEIVGMTPFMLMKPDEAERVGSIYNETVAQHRPFSLLENSLVHKDGRIVVMETSGAPFFDSDGAFSGYRGIDRDISERKALETLEHTYQQQLERQVQEQTLQLQLMISEQHKNYYELQTIEASLRQSEFRFRQIFEHNRDALVLFDFETEAVTDANPVAQLMFEGARATLLGMSWDDFNVRDGTNTPLNLSEIGNQSEFMLLRGGVTTLTGIPLVVSIWGKVLQLEGRPVAYCSMRDITERSRQEKEAQQIQTKLIQTNKMTSLGFMVAGIAHEINNPNNNILLSAQLLSNTWQDVLPILDRRFSEEGDFILAGDFYSEVRESVPQYLNMITDGSRRIEIIINNLRDFTIKTKFVLTQDVDINKVASISASILQHQIKKHTRNFTLSLSPEPLLAKGNQQQLEQVIVNLIVNAIQSLPSMDRAVRLSTSCDPSQKSIIIGISDEGCGILPEHLPHIFDPFFSTKLETGGTGLGLAISSNIIREHGGRLDVASAAGSGTTATITLPVPGDHP